MNKYKEDGGFVNLKNLNSNVQNGIMKLRQIALIIM